MLKFNIFKNTTKNNEGHVAFKMELKEKLITEVLTSFFNEGKYYGDNSLEIVNDLRKVIKIDPKFVANLAIYARKEVHLRSISHVIVSELANDVQGKKYVRRVLNGIVERVDDMSEVLIYYLNVYGKPIPNSLKKGISDCFLRFDEFSLAKYNGAKEIKLKDIVNLVHPKPATDKQSHMFKRLFEDNLETPFTWETMLSSEGNNKHTWEKLIDSNKLGYMAILRNLRNIIKAGPENINKVYEVLENDNRVKKSKQLPFRYYSAFNVLSNEGLGTSKIYDVLENAIRHSTKNIERLSGKTFISTDVSGSMSSRVSAKSDMTCAEIGTVLMAIANNICDEAITSTFDTKFKITPLATQNGIIANAKSIRPTWGGTDLSLPIRYLLENKIYVDRIILLSDNEINSGYERVCQAYVNEYKKKVNPNVWVHAIDILGYGTQQFKGNKVNVIAGWNEKILEFIPKVEAGFINIKGKIEDYYFKEELKSII
ncbi:TROVE domain-containing protein [Clostridium weizhouense]|uniref:TROVE domain-containing protein n=1 Tax=Clostridium weizhouense TaxID=2859781 RepID=A0ABS7AKB0_9CLOT|nr:TROVE domain-containing protein [Clostridium weizhouense]MBW6409057.1 TROVE domain-containing protein [Clostridium weizhouense]